VFAHVANLKGCLFVPAWYICSLPSVASEAAALGQACCIRKDLKRTRNCPAPKDTQQHETLQHEINGAMSNDGSSPTTSNEPSLEQPKALIGAARRTYGLEGEFGFGGTVEQRGSVGVRQTAQRASHHFQMIADSDQHTNQHTCSKIFSVNQWDD
jgi:hypothetical protein